ncbi:hypothetical protein F5I97DRAFT_1816300, partial [Phlebopus sp. FC_14]
EKRMHAAGLTAVAIHGDRVVMAQQAKEDLFARIHTGVAVVLVSPEQLKSPKFRAVIDGPRFSQRVRMMAVHEAHLMNL